MASCSTILTARASFRLRRCAACGFHSGEDVFHLRGLAFNMTVGISPISLARDSIGVSMAQEQQAGRWISNGARPAGILTVKNQLSEPAAERLRKQWQNLREGLSNTGTTAILEDGMDWKPMQLNSVDLQFIEQRKLSVEDVSRWFGVPLWKLNVSTELKSLRLDDADQAYVNATIMPDLELWEQKFDKEFSLRDNGMMADFDERKLLRASESTRVDNQRKRVMSALATPNECRAEEGLPPLPGGDELMFPVNAAALGSDVSGSAADHAGRPDDGTLADPGNGSRRQDGE